MTEHLPGVLGFSGGTGQRIERGGMLEWLTGVGPAGPTMAVYQEMVQEPSVVLYTSLDVLAGLQ